VTPVTTTTIADPPTVIAVTPSESPAIVGDVITYSMTVADVLTATQGAAYMTDNGTTITGCTGPTPNINGSLDYSCTETYTSADVGSHLIVGVFLGDATYGQSAGQLNEPVDLTAPVTVVAPTGGSQPVTTTTSPPPTTTTTTTPPPTLTVSCVATTEGFPAVAPTNYAVDATVTGSDGTTPNGTNFTYSISGNATLNTNAGGNGSNFASYHFSDPGTYTVTVTYSSNAGTYAGISGSGSCQIVIS
jgi:hypothetical protein